MEISPQLEVAPQVDIARNPFNFLGDYRVARAIVAGVSALGIGIGLAESATGAGAETHITTSAPEHIKSAADLPDGVTLKFPGSEIVYESTSESHSSVKASDVAKGKLTILSYLKANGVPKKEITYPNCFWSVRGGMNSGTTIYNPNHPKLSQVEFFKDDRPTLVCKDSASPTGYEKAGNHGPNGTIVDNCGNYFIPFGKPPEHVTYVNTPVILEKKFSDKMDISVKASALAIGRDASGRICGEAEATAKASEQVSVEGYLKSGEGTGNEAVEEFNSVTTELSAEASAHVNCGTTVIVIEKKTPTTTTMPKKHTTTTTTMPKKHTTTTTTMPKHPTTTTTTQPRPTTTTTTTQPVHETTTTTTQPRPTTTTTTTQPVHETTTTTTMPAPQNYLEVSMEQQTPAFEGDYVGVPFQICADGSSTINGDNLTYKFSTDPQGKLSMQGGEYPNPLDPSGSECAMYEASAPYANDYVDVTLSDSDGLKSVYASTGTFPDRQLQ